MEGAGSNPKTRAGIIKAAERCFQRYGVEKTSMGDIAGEADISRATVYNYFSKRDLVAEVLFLERRRVNAKACRSLDLSLGSPELLVEAELQLLDTALKSRFAKFFTGPDAVALTADIVGHSERFATVQAEYWGPVFEALRDRGDLDPDLDEAEALNWLNSITFLLAVGPATFGADRATRHRYLLRYVAPSFLRRS